MVATCSGLAGKLLVEISHVGHGGGGRRDELRIVGLLQNLIEVEHTEKTGPKKSEERKIRTRFYNKVVSYVHTYIHT